MKKIFYFTLIALFAAVSCSKEITKTENNAENVKLNTYTIGATILSDEVKANIDEESLRVLWQVNDKIGLVDAEGNITPATLLEDFVGKSSAYFTYEAESPVVAVYAFYPYTETATVTGTTLTTVLPASQNFAMIGKLVAQNNLLMAGKANAEGGIEFKNTCAVVKIAVKGTENYARRLYVQTPDKKISGEGTIDLSADAPVFTTAAVNEVSEVATKAKLDQRTSTIVLNPWNGDDHRLHVTPEGTENDEYVYMVVPAGTYTNFCVETLGNTDPVSTEAATAVDLAYTSSKEFTLAVGKIRPLTVTLAMPEEGENVVNLTPGKQRANSFLIEDKDAKTYIFDTRVGGTDYADGKQNIVVQSGYYATLLWETTPGLVKNVRLDAIGKKISFEKSADMAGNAVIALRERNGKIHWTWHVWVAGETVESRKFGTVEFMDRNLGALAVNSGTVADAGLHYEWGRKDPFPGAGSYAAANGNSIETYPDVVRTVKAQNGQAISWATALPYVYIWGEKNDTGAEDWCNATPQDTNMWGNWGTTKPKTIYDPCPYGYRVPNGGAFASTMIAAIKTAAITNYNKSITDDNGADFYIPVCGYWRRSTNSTEMCNIGTHAWLWTMTSNASTDVVNTSYIGAACFTTSNNAAAVTRKTKRRWGANIRCVKFDENAVNVQ